MENFVSTYNRSLVLEEIKETENLFLDLLPLRRQQTSHVSHEIEPAVKVVKVSGSITVSF